MKGILLRLYKSRHGREIWVFYLEPAAVIPKHPENFNTTSLNASVITQKYLYGKNNDTFTSRYRCYLLFSYIHQ